MRGLQKTAPAPGERGAEPDPRERDAAFQRLPREVQDLRREGWIEQELEWERVERLSGNDRKSVMLHGIGVFAAAEIALGVSTGLYLASLIPALLIGACVGLLWWKFDAGIVIAPMIAMPPYLVLQVALWQTSAGTTLGVLAGPLLVGFTSAYLGMQRGFTRGV